MDFSWRSRNARWVRCVARSTGARPVRADPQVVAGQRMAVFAVGLTQMLLVLGVGHKHQVVGIPARVNAAAMMELLAGWYGTAKEPSAEAVGVAVLRLGDATVGGGRPSDDQQVPNSGCVGPSSVRSTRRSSSDRRVLGWFRPLLGSSMSVSSSAVCRLCAAYVEGGTSSVALEAATPSHRVREVGQVPT